MRLEQHELDKVWIRSLTAFCAIFGRNLTKPSLAASAIKYGR